MLCAHHAAQSVDMGHGMRLILGAAGLAVTSATFLIVSGFMFYEEFAFDARAVELDARIVDKEVDVNRHRRRRSVDHDFILDYRLPDGSEYQVRKEVNGELYRTKRVGQLLQVRVDPAYPKTVIVGYGHFAARGMFAGMAALIAGVASAICIMVARDRASENNLKVRSQRPINARAEVDQAFR